MNRARLRVTVWVGLSGVWLVKKAMSKQWPRWITRLLFAILKWNYKQIRAIAGLPSLAHAIRGIEWRKQVKQP
jgi:hypothetical protein